MFSKLVWWILQNLAGFINYLQNVSREVLETFQDLIKMQLKLYTCSWQLSILPAIVAQTG